MSFRRHMLSGVESIDAYLKKHMVLWYSPAKEGVTNESIAETQTLSDLSGNGRDLTLCEFDYSTNSVISSDNGLQFDNKKSYAVCNSQFLLKDFTIFYNHSQMPYYTLPNNYQIFCQKGNTFILNDLSSARCLKNYSFAKTYNNTNKITHSYYEHGLYCMVPYTLIRCSDFSKTEGMRGVYIDSLDNLLIFNSGQHKFSFRLYEFLLFDKTLSDKHIQYVIDNYINKTE